MSATTQEMVTVEGHTQYGVKGNGGQKYNLSPRLKQQNVTPQHFQVGVQYLMEIWTGPQGGRNINGFSPVNAAPAHVAAAPAVPYQAPALPPVPPVPAAAPSIPQTNLHTTPAPGGIPPVAPTPTVGNGNGHAKVKDEDKMSKADWAAKDRKIELLAIVKSTLEGAALGQLVVGKNESEAFQIGTNMIRYYVQLFDQLSAGR